MSLPGRSEQHGQNEKTEQNETNEMNGAEAPQPRYYGGLTKTIYADALHRGKFPVVTTNAKRLEAQAKEHLGSVPFAFIAGGAGEGATMDANRLAFRQWKIIPRMLTPSTHHDLRTELFGHKLPSPLVICPVGVQQMFHKDKELATAAAAAELGVPYTHSTAATTSMEEAARANGDGLRFYQLYWPKDNELTLSLLGRAKAAGYSVLVLTLDTWHVGFRPGDLDTGYNPFIEGVGIQGGVSDPVFRRLFQERHPGLCCEDDMVKAAELWSSLINNGQAHTWDELAFIRRNWEGPLVLKGIQHADDARRAVDEAGVDGIWVSNHGGRQLDGAIGSLDCLAGVAETVGDRTTILFDSGVRTGTDVIKALCLGAHAVCIGRPWVYGLAIRGRQGVVDVMQGILQDLDSSIGCAGLASLSDCRRSVLRRVQYPGDTLSCR